MEATESPPAAALTEIQIDALAPDPAAAAAGRKLASPATWSGLGRDDAAFWGECQGSAVYRVVFERASLAYKCTCPSFKRPCKHALALGYLVARGKVAEAAPSVWVAEWLQGRQARAEAAAKKAELAPPGAGGNQPSEHTAKAPSAKKTAAKRDRQVDDGLDQLDAWLADLVRSGFAGLERQPPGYWEQQAARMVDAKAKGLAVWIRRMSAIPHSGDDWPARLLDEAGRLALLVRSYRRLDALPAPLQADIRQLVGWDLKKEEVHVHGDSVADDWAILGQWTEPEQRGLVRRTWLFGLGSHRWALLLDFSFAGQPFSSQLVPGVRQTLELSFYPGASAIRALVKNLGGEPALLPASLPTTSVEEGLASFAGALARNPWLDRHPLLLDAVSLVRRREAWFLRSETGASLPLRVGEHWRLHALSGGRPIVVAGEWDGWRFRPLGAVSSGEFVRLAD